MDSTDKNMLMRTVFIVRGKVQKSDYRGRVIEIAKELDLTGTVQNLSDGNVKIVVEGDAETIKRFKDDVWIRNFLIKVTEIEKIKENKIDGKEYESFYKLVGQGETDERLDDVAKALKEVAGSIDHLNITIGSFISEQKEFNREQKEFNKDMKEYNKDMKELLKAFVQK